MNLGLGLLLSPYIFVFLQLACICTATHGLNIDPAETESTTIAQDGNSALAVPLHGRRHVRSVIDLDIEGLENVGIVGRRAPITTTITTRANEIDNLDATAQPRPLTRTRRTPTSDPLTFLSHFIHHLSSIIHKLEHLITYLTHHTPTKHDSKHNLALLDTLKEALDKLLSIKDTLRTGELSSSEPIASRIKREKLKKTRRGGGESLIENSIDKLLSRIVGDLSEVFEILKNVLKGLKHGKEKREEELLDVDLEVEVEAEIELEEIVEELGGLLGILS